MKEIFPATILAVLLSACCSESITNESVKFQSNPEGAEVVINGEVRGTTPCAIVLNKESTHNVLIKKEGFKDESFVLASTEATPFIKFGPLDDLGFYKELTPNPVEANFASKDGAKPAEAAKTAEAPKAQAK